MNILRPYEHDSETSARITLLETLPVEEQYKTLGMKMVFFDAVFRKVNLQGPSSPPKRFATHQSATISPTATILPPGLNLPSKAAPPPAQSDSSSWATTTKNGSHNRVISIAPARTSVPAPGTVYYVNASDERIDAHFLTWKTKNVTISTSSQELPSSATDTTWARTVPKLFPRSILTQRS